MSKTKFAPFDACDYLDSEEVIGEYLTAALKDPDPSVFLLAEANVAKVRGMTASDAWVREHEQKAFHVSELSANVIDELGSVAIPTTAAKFNHEFKKR
jgi:DNA-binding phage protein